MYHKHGAGINSGQHDVWKINASSYSDTNLALDRAHMTCEDRRSKLREWKNDTRGKLDLILKILEIR